MNIYTAILRAADHIERHPQLFNFSQTDIPDCGTPGCALGWIGHFADASRDQTISVVAKNEFTSDVTRHREGPAYEFPLLGDITHAEFYRRMAAFAGNWDWMRTAWSCAKALRQYAEKYHAVDKPVTRTDAQLVAALLSKLATPVSKDVSEELTW